MIAFKQVQNNIPMVFSIEKCGLADSTRRICRNYWAFRAGKSTLLRCINRMHEITGAHYWLMRWILIH